MEDDLNFCNGRQPKLLKMEDDLNLRKWDTTSIFRQWKTTSILRKWKTNSSFIQMVYYPIFKTSEDNLNFKT